jgi:hypothetical protein
LFHGAGTVTLIALSTWVVTALFGANLLIQGKAYRLLVRAVSRRMPTGKRPPFARAIMMTLHLLCATAGLAAWTAYAMFHRNGYGYIALGLLLLVAVLGISIVDRWRNGYGRHARPIEHRRGFPVWSATLHVMMATTTLVLVVLVTVLRIGR